MIKVRKAGNNVVVNTQALKEFMKRYFEMNEVKKSAFQCGDKSYIIFSYRNTDDFKIVRYGYDESVVIDSFTVLKEDYPKVFSEMKDNIWYFL